MNSSTSAQPATPCVDLTLNGRQISAPQGTTLAAALMNAGIGTRESVSGWARSPLCAMGICMECCATVNGVKHVRTCQVDVQQSMTVVTR
ncbi:(2Fe-2S)-binding protein [Telmatobacter sp. DSM 110680]|uniref:(2Fe-2S)-binding protein n=1 Tax=Telmatobacter sp. DSM 110680 TaxID=3036704 RepID=A0AAU7DMW5_9BACT